MAKTKGKPENIFRSVATFNGLLQLFGLGFHLDVKTGEMRVNLCNRIGFLLNLSWSVLGIVVSLSEKPMASKSEVVTTVWHYQYQLQVILVLPLLIFNYINRKHAANFLAKLNEFDEAMEKVKWTSSKLFRTGIFRYHEISFLATSILFLIFYQVFVVRALLLAPNVELSIVRFLVYIYVTEFFLLITFKFMFAVSNVRKRFFMLNEKVRQVVFASIKVSWKIFLFHYEIAVTVSE